MPYRLPSQHLNTQDSIQHRLSYLKGKVESISEMTKFLIEETRRNDMLCTEVIAKRQCQCNNDFDKKSVQEGNNELQKRVTELERIVISGILKPNQTSSDRKIKDFKLLLMMKRSLNNSDRHLHEKRKNANCDDETQNHQPTAKIKVRKKGKQYQRPHDHQTIAII